MSTLNIEIIGKGKPLVLLHGWGWDSRVFAPLVSQVQDRYQFFLIDIPGAGKSPLLSGSYDFQRIIPSMLARLPLNASWLGWSLGGIFAFWTAIYYPEYVSRLITVASSPRFTMDKDWPGLDSATLHKFTDLLINNPNKTLIDFLELQLRGSSNRKKLATELKKISILPQQISMPALKGGLNLLVETDLRKDLTKINCPNLHIFGQNDTIVPVKVIKALSPLLPQSKFEVIKHSGHMPFLSHPEDFRDLINHFLI